MPRKSSARCRPGRHGFSREQVAHNQRERLIAGLADGGRRARLRRGDDRPHHRGGEGLAPRLLRELREQGGVLPRRLRRRRRPHPRAGRRGGRGRRPTGPTRRSPRRAQSLAFLASEPDLARLCLVESQSAGPGGRGTLPRGRRRAGAPAAAGARRARRAARELPPTTEDSTIGALVSLASRKVAAGEAAELEDLLPDFAEFILAPYLGPEEAERLSAASA